MASIGPTTSAAAASPTTAGCSCRACGTAGVARLWSVPEKMYGTGETFLYAECPHCGSLSLCHVPEEMSRYYPEGYYSQALKEQGLLARWLKRLRGASALGRGNPAGRLLVALFGIPPVVRWLTPATTDRNAKILDVGSGSGRNLQELSLAGFRSLTGVDPYLMDDTTLRGNVRLYRGAVTRISGPFDVVMMHHVLEHVQDPLEALRHIRTLLTPGGMLVIRTPAAGGYAWRCYGANWIQLDPPRHICVFSRRGLEQLAAQAGYAPSRVLFDSDAFQFWGSEQDRRHIPLLSPASYAVNPRGSVFTRAQIREFTARAAVLNASGDGDQLCAYFQRSGD